MHADDIHITYADVDVNSIQLNLNHDLDNLNIARALVLPNSY